MFRALRSTAPAREFILALDRKSAGAVAQAMRLVLLDERAARHRVDRGVRPLRRAADALG